MSEPTTGVLALGKAFQGTPARNFRQKLRTGHEMEAEELREVFCQEWSTAIADAVLRDDEDADAVTGQVLVTAYLTEAAPPCSHGQSSNPCKDNASRQQSSSSEFQSAPCRPQRPTAMTPFDVCIYWPLELGAGIHASRVLSARDPEYSEAARKANLNGSVVVVLAINEKGSVDDAKVVHSSDRRFELNAIDAVKQWEFAPATKDGGHY